MDRKGLCNEDCNRCPIIGDPNNRLLTFILNKTHNKFGDDFYKIVQEACPNLTCCFDCRTDDFCHVEGCEIMKKVEQSDIQKPEFGAAEVRKLDVDAEDKEAT